jgi:hypothetical protein
MTGLVPRQVAPRITPGFSGRSGDEIIPIASWLTSDEGLSDPWVRQWINFLAAHYAQFRIIQTLFPRENPGRQGRKDHYGCGTSAKEMLVIANHLFILRSHGVEGCVLECGCYKGYSSCCLSIACRRLGYPLVIADTFAGLPPAPETVGDHCYYQVGDFAGSRPEVEQNLRTFGDPAGVELVEGCFSDTLKGWNRPLSLLWLDVDLESSVMDVLNPCLSHLDPRGAIFSHEFLATSIKDGQIVEEHGPAAAIARVVQEDDPDYSAAYTTEWLAIVGRHTSISLQSYRLLSRLVPFLGRISKPSARFSRAHLSRFLRKVAKTVRVSDGFA